MPDSKNDKSPTDQNADADAAPSTPTEVVKLGDDAPQAPEPKGGDSDSPTKAFAVPAEVAAAAAEVTADEAAANEADEVESSESTESSESKDTEDAPNDSTEGSVESSADVTETVQIAKPAAAATAASEAAVSEAGVSEAGVSEAGEVDTDATTQFTVPAPAAAEAAPAAAEPAPAPAPAQAQPAAPQVITPPAAPAEPKANRGKLIGILVAAVVVIAAVVIGIWYMTIGTSPETKVADAATTYQQAMNDGDLATLRDITCGEENTVYTSMDEGVFQKAYAAQKANNQLMKFDEVNAVSIDGDTAKVGVDIYPSGDPSKTEAVQITLQKVGDDWKVCKTLN